MAHRWSSEDIAALIEVALQHPARGPGRDRAAAEFAQEISREQPGNPLAESAARYAIDVAAGALEGGVYGASAELLRQIALRRQGPPAPGNPAQRLLSLEDRRLELAIDACLWFPPGEIDERRAVFTSLELDPPADKFFAGVDNAILKQYESQPRPSSAVRARVERRRCAGSLHRNW